MFYDIISCLSHSLKINDIIRPYTTAILTRAPAHNKRDHEALLFNHLCRWGDPPKFPRLETVDKGTFLCVNLFFSSKTDLSRENESQLQEKFESRSGNGKGCISLRKK